MRKNIYYVVPLLIMVLLMLNHIVYGNVNHDMHYNYIANTDDDNWIYDEDTIAVDTVAVDTIDFYEEYNPNYDNDYAVTSVAGIDFGDSKETVMSELHSRFGYDDKDEGNMITFYEISIGGVDYSFAHFFFLKGKFVSATLTKYFPVNNFQAAKNYRDRIARQYGSKYRNIISRTDKNGIKYYLCGRLDVFLYPIEILLEKTKGKDGISRYYVSVNYYSHRINAALNDDI